MNKVSGVMGGTTMTEQEFLDWCAKHLPAMKRAVEQGCPSLRETVKRLEDRKFAIKRDMEQRATYAARDAAYRKALRAEARRAA